MPLSIYHENHDLFPQEKTTPNENRFVLVLIKVSYPFDAIKVLYDFENSALLPEFALMVVFLIWDGCSTYNIFK